MQCIYFVFTPIVSGCQMTNRRKAKKVVFPKEFAVATHKRLNINGLHRSSARPRAQQIKSRNRIEVLTHAYGLRISAPQCRMRKNGRAPEIGRSAPLT